MNWFIILASVVTGYISISAFTCLLGVPVGIMSSAIELRTCTITAAIRKSKLIIKKKEKKAW